MTLNVCLAILVYFFVPETKQVPLEKMDTIFGGVDKSEKGTVMIEEATETANTQTIDDSARGTSAAQDEKISKVA